MSEKSQKDPEVKCSISNACIPNGTNVCVRCGRYQAGQQGFVCKEYVQNGEQYTCKNCGFNFMLHGWEKDPDWRWMSGTKDGEIWWCVNTGSLILRYYDDRPDVQFTRGSCHHVEIAKP